MVAFGLADRARILVPQIAETTRNRWWISLVDYDEELNEISTLTFNHQPRVDSLAPSPSDKHAFITSFNGTAKLWQPKIVPITIQSFRSEDVYDLQELASFPTGTSGCEINRVVWKAGEGPCIFGFSSKSAAIFDVGSGSSISLSSILLSPEPDPEEMNLINCGVWNPHNIDSVGLGIGKAISEFDTRSNDKTLEIASAHEMGVRTMDYNHNKSFQIVSGGDDCMVKVWDTRNTKKALKEICNHSHWVWKVCLNRYHDQLLLSCSSDSQINLESIVSVSSTPIKSYSPTSDEEERTEAPIDGLIATFDQHEESVYNVAWSPADPWIFASVSYDARVVVNIVPQEHKYKIIM